MTTENDKKTLDEHAAQGRTVVVLYREGRRYCGTVHHDGRRVASIAEATPLRVLTGLGQILAALALEGETASLAEVMGLAATWSRIIPDDGRQKD